jgi:hypothetical protein
VARAATGKAGPSSRRARNQVLPDRPGPEYVESGDMVPLLRRLPRDLPPRTSLFSKKTERRDGPKRARAPSLAMAEIFLAAAQWPQQTGVTGMSLALKKRRHQPRRAKSTACRLHALGSRGSHAVMALEALGRMVNPAVETPPEQTASVSSAVPSFRRSQGTKRKNLHRN